jgi:3-isopropylmalate/(R)-2-methylmalate dehydratase small subunit
VKPEVLEGRVAWIFEDHFDVDLIVGVENVKTSDPTELLRHCMKAYDPGFVSSVAPGDVLVAGRNFGYGHPHYPAMIAMRAAGIACVVADSFAPGFRRGETYNGMILVTCPGIANAARRWDRIRVAWREGRVELPDRGARLQGIAPSPRVIEVIEAGGMYELLKSRHARPASAAPGARG